MSPTTRTILLIPLVLLIAACAAPQPKQQSPLDATRQLVEGAAENAGNEEYIRQVYESRTWVPFGTFPEDPVELGKEAEIPVQKEGVKLLGPSQDDALRSLALKIWMIENAQHTVDVVYYIFKPDLVGQSMLGALCNAVQRGVDVRIMVDSIGSMSPSHNDLRALETCAEDAAYIRDADGQPTPYRARVQAVIFNSLTKSIGWANRRSHDKLMVIDGAFPAKTAVLTGGRNISLSYYGIKADGSPDPTAYRDLEILLRSGADTNFGEPGVGTVGGIYYTLLFLHRGNKRIRPVYHDSSEDYVFFDEDPYRAEREAAQKSLARLKSFPEIRQHMDNMPGYVSTGFQESKVLLAHELGNLTNRSVVTNTEQNRLDNPNSIMYIMDKAGQELKPGAAIRIVSPYLFIAKYYDKDGNVVEDGVADAHRWLYEHPENRLEIVTNSVLTSDNFLAQSIIDMDLGPRLLLPTDLEKAWLSSLDQGEFNPEVVESEDWKKAVNHPQIFVYQTGKLDAKAFGQGNREYGKLHAKFIIGGEIGFVGTANFDYRSRLFNNEMGFFYHNDQVNEDLNQIFDDLKETSYRWGSPEWLQMRKEVMELSGMKGWSTRKQRFFFKFMRATGLDWLI